ncbi:uncharacterized protein isoform X2 [Choristoneura fumiferana]|uniref:uncharacterized protein isoform X2 n=1 Tax=Choristoneura fumiferana TaxID=7141 RepID=UPI003D15DE79
MNVYHMSRWCNQEERPTLVLPWLLLAAIRKLLCELLSLALGLATCLLVGPARPPCIKFVVIKIISIMPAFYMWMLVLSYYHALKVAAAFKTFRAAVPSNDLDYGLELAIRRRRTKSLFGEALVRSHLMSNLYSDKQINIAGNIAISKENNNFSPNDLGSTDTKKSVKLDIENKENTFYENQTAVDLNETVNNINEVVQAYSIPNRLPSDLGTYEDWFGNEIIVPRNTDRINEQFGLMLLRISAFLQTEKNGPNQIFEAASMLSVSESQVKNLNCPSLTDEATDTPPLVASKKSNIASYLRDYPDIFMKKNDSQLQHKLDSIRVVHSQIEGKSNERTHNEQRQAVRINSGGNVTLDLERPLSEKKSGTKHTHARKQKKKKTDNLKHMENTKNELESVDNSGETSKRQNSAEALKEGSSSPPISSASSLTSTIDRIKSSLTKAKSSRKRKDKNAPSSSHIGSTSTSSGESEEKGV